MRKFLYITPYFPPMSRVGALRPLKFARHQPDYGWTPVVLCDMWKGAAIDTKLLSAVPESVPVVRNYTRGAKSAMKEALDPTASAAKKGPRKSGPGLERFVPKWLDNPEILPLSDHALAMPYSVKAALDLLEQEPCDAIVVNADPYEALLVGAKVARKSGLPLVLEFRDPWSVCELRRKMRPAPTRWTVDRMERRAVAAAAAVVLNTATALADYREHYADLPQERFHMIRNHSDSELISAGEAPVFDKFTVLFLGHFRRFVEGDVLLEMLAELAARGRSDEVQLVVTGNCPAESYEKARSLGVEHMLVKKDFVPYLETGTYMGGADLLVLLNNRTQQRIPAKFYEYVTSSKPILAIADNHEMTTLFSQIPNAEIVGLDEPKRAADVVEAALVGDGEARDPATQSEFTSQTASRRLADILDRVCT